MIFAKDHKKRMLKSVSEYIHYEIWFFFLFQEMNWIFQIIREIFLLNSI